ncbi:capsular exopolysaccharide family protein [Isoalcanivorax pacificus W11-5]|uniref:Capsular exopolysaccharide family protein n=1 Tax=Isoalcanivorax pacificus W11-5 TaxID=391936 RepID=A0A0B4XN91_9GAMM|nr:polysaccharide biosynthesis tyrosine autokinase [Isoalcanivorax pacificus]AJD48541.1 capsular exopolysaccharide family protein [Isoalcanivorax pacificus W11-5]
MTEQDTKRGMAGRMAAGANDEIDLTRLWALLVDHRWQIGLITAMAFIVGVIYTFVATPIYRADALLQIEARQSGLPVLGDLSEMLGSESSAQTEIEIIRSRMVIGNAADELRADIQVQPASLPVIGRFFGPEEKDNRILFAGWADTEKQLWIDQLAVPEWLLGSTFILEAGEGGSFTLTLDGEPVLEGEPGKEARSADQRIAIRVAELNAEPGTRFEVVKQSRRRVMQQLLANLSVAEKGRNTGILTVSMTGANPEKVSKILDAVARNYLLQNVQRRSAEAEKSLEFLDEQVPEIRDELNAAEEKLNAYRLESESVDLSLETKAVLDQLVQLEAKLNELKFRESEVNRLYTREHPAYRTLMEQRRSFEEERERLNSQVKNLPETQQQILRLMRDVELNQEIYVQLLNRVQELRIMKAGTIGNVRIIDNAQVQPEPIKPQKALVVVLATLLGLMGAVGQVFVRAAFNRGIESPDQLEQEGIPVYATLPLSEDQIRNERLISRISRRRGTPNKTHQLLAQTNPGDLTIEALRSLRTSLHFAMLEASNNVLMISGPSPEVGKSFVSANFAMVLAQVGQRVVLVDGDLRKGHLHRYFPSDHAVGLSTYLAGRNSREEVTLHTDIPGLDFIGRGEIPPNPAELLMHPRFQGLMEELSRDYDLVLIDTPPILAVTDAAIIGNLAGTSLVVTRYGRNSIKEVEQTLGRFEQNGVHVKGCILNAVERKASNAYSYYAYEYK